MFKNDIRKKLLKHKWVGIMNDSKNPTQSWHRIRTQAVRGLNDLTLLAENLPDEKQGEIFDTNKIFSFMNAILLNTRPSRRTALAKTMVMLGIRECTSQYKLLMEETPDLGEPIISHLRQSVAICADIAHRSELMERDINADKQGMAYLFEWNTIIKNTTKYAGRFVKFLAREVDSPVSIGSLELSNDGKSIRGTFNTDYDLESYWSFILELNDETNIGFKVFDENGNERASKNLIVKKDGDSIFVYEKKKH
jgi:hypothetical protein